MTLTLCGAPQLEKAYAQLAVLREEARAVELNCLKARRRAAQDTEAAVAEYDVELGARETEFKQALAAFNELRSQVEVCHKQGRE
jgi:hypothetical protein